MKIKDLFLFKTGACKAIFNIEMEGVVVKSWRIVKGKKGLFVCPPSRPNTKKDSEYEYENLAYYVDDEARDRVRKLAMKAYRDKVGGGDEDEYDERRPKRRNDDDDDPPPRRRKPTRDEDDDPPPRRRKPAEDEDEPPKRKPRRDEDEDDEPPKRKRRYDEDEDEDPDKSSEFEDEIPF